MLSTLFTHLYDHDVIHTDSFISWKQDTLQANQEEKGVAVMSCIQFLTWILENEEDEDADS